MTVWKFRDTWRYEFRVRGVRYGGNGYPTKREANEAEAEHRKRLKRRKPTNRKFEEVCNARLVDLAIRRTPKYYDENKKLIDNLELLWGYKNEITRKDVQQYLNGVAKNSTWTANKELRFIRALFNLGIKEELIDYNPTNGIQFYPVKRKVKYVPPHEDIDKILDIASLPDKDYLLVVALTLGRIREVNRLKWSDIKTDYLILRTRKARNSDIVERQIPLTTPLKEVIKRIPKKGTYVFINPKTGTKYEYRKGMLRGLCKRAKVKYFTFHALRHYGASALAKAGVPRTDIQTLLGHANMTTTDIYLHSLGLSSVLNSLEKLQFPAQ